MFNFLAKSLFVTVVWRQYKRLIISSLLLFASYYLIGFMHDDYLEYATTAEGTRSIAGAYLLKWAALLLVSAGYYFVNFPLPFLGKNTRHTQQSPSQKEKNRPRGIKPPVDESDPFENIRRKKNLKGKGDRVLGDENEGV
ncbi:hypothetical protein SAMN02745866_02051 [Alteromonadaceae bacterium Bs31]|nr:hypothetical protein SAMN02745866_02051 [Alteromonadaceae bacterium Bs31]